MDPEFTPETIRAMPDDKLRDHTQSLSEGLESFSEEAQAAYRLMREEMERRGLA